jgi:hypothetical protein
MEMPRSPTDFSTIPGITQWKYLSNGETSKDK